MTRTDLAWLAAFFLCAGSAAEAPGIPGLVARLGDPDAQARDEAMAELAALGDAAGQALLEAERSADAEIADRARRLVDRIPWVRPAFHEEADRLLDAMRRAHDLQEGSLAFERLRGMGKGALPAFEKVFASPTKPALNLSAGILPGEKRDKNGLLRRGYQATLRNDGEEGIWINANGLYAVIGGTPCHTRRKNTGTGSGNIRYNCVHLAPGEAYETVVAAPIPTGVSPVVLRYDAEGGGFVGHEPFKQVRPAGMRPLSDEEALFVPRPAPVSLELDVGEARNPPPLEPGGKLAVEARFDDEKRLSPGRKVEPLISVTGGSPGDIFAVMEVWASFVGEDGAVAGFFRCALPDEKPLRWEEGKVPSSWKAGFTPDLAPGTYALVFTCIGAHLVPPPEGAPGPMAMGLPRKTIAVSGPVPVELR